MARGGNRRTYVRDGNGRFASTPGGGPSRTTPKARRAATRAGNRLNRDNSGRISGIGRDGATVRGGRIKTAKGNRRATQTASMKAAGFRGSTIAKRTRASRPAGTVAKPKGMKPGVLAARRGVKAGPAPSLVAGARRRASERPEVALQRKKQRAIAKYSEASNKASQTKTALFRRRGKLDPDQRRIVAKENRKASKAMSNLNDAIGRYNQGISDATSRRDSMVAYRTRRKAPVTPRRLANTVRTLQNKLKLQKSDGLFPADIEKTSKALRAASQELAKVGGVGMTFRTKKDAIKRQRARSTGVVSYRLNNYGGVTGRRGRESLRKAAPDQPAPGALKASRKRGQLNMFGGLDVLPTRGRTVFSSNLEYRAKSRKRRLYG